MRSRSGLLVAALLAASCGALVRSESAPAPDASTGISCVADGVCQTSCAVDPDCPSGGVDAAAPDAGRAGAGAPAAGRVDAGGNAQYTCTAAFPDDGTSGAASLGAASLDCQLRSTGSNWPAAMSYCAGIGTGWRLTTKGEALKIASSPNVCRTALPASWFTWTRTCARAGRAWLVSNYGGTSQGSVDNSYISALCVR